MLHANEAAAMAFLWSVAVKSTALLSAAWLGVFALRRRSAAARHLVWMAAFAAALALPILSIALPAIELPRTAWLPDAASFVIRTDATASRGAATQSSASSSVSTSVASHAPSARAAAPAFPALDWPMWIALICAAGSAAMLLQTTLAYLRMAQRRRAARPFDAACDLPQGVMTLEAQAGSMPMTFGVLHPVVFLPADAIEWSDERRALVLRHELAHIERGDAAMHLAARTALSLLWWNPLAWKAWREFLKEREKAADDLVLAGGARASDYAGHLLEIARSMQSEPATAWAAVAMARRSELEGRLLSILDSRASRKAARRASAFTAAAVAIALCAPFAAVRAQSPQAALPADIEATIRAAFAQKNHEILDNAASAFEKLQNYDTAQQLLASSLEIRAAIAGDRSKEYAAGLVKLGDLEAKRLRKSEATAFYSKAVGLGDSAETAPALVYLGIHAIEEMDFPAAMGFFQRAVAASDSPNTTGRAYMWMAMVEQTNKDHAAEAETDFRKSIADLDLTSSEAATSRTLFAMFLRKRERAGEAEPFENEASAIKQTLVRSGNTENEVLNKFALRAGGDVSRPALVLKVEPEYTEEARTARLQGVAVLYVVIEADGSASHIRVMKSLGLGLDEKAIEAVQKWHFRPGVKNGVAVPVAATVEVNFKLL